MRLYNVAVSIANAYKRKVRTELAKEPGIKDYNIVVIGQKSYIFLNGLYLMCVPTNEVLVLGDGKTTVADLPRVVIKKTGLFTGVFVEKKGKKS